MEMNLRFSRQMWQASEVDEELIVFFDEDCLLCQGAVKWLNRIDGNDRLKFAPLQGETAERYEIDLSDDSMAFAERGNIYRAGEAARRAFWNAGGWGVFLACLIMALPDALRDWAYQWVAKNRKCLVKNRRCDLPEEGMNRKTLK
jgi:predicted DCC family thiol-disulfide oxidoreductase YuxK